ncbi:putative zinc finger protein [Lyophyllum shimeji]|uniref:Zinc finger protein n=1 Tax=Lyophyllum shimeji TaxID=47721 RepID=A0A9P3PDA3_LYOSH|nr:putative zinc finger protein [Lyophyllum shimeji]
MPTSDTQEKPSDALLLPAHVSVFGNEPVQILPPTNMASDDEDYIDYLDYDESSKNVLRYYDEPVMESTKPSRTVCKNCGAEGEHKTAACPVLICLTCGARNEHGTRSCPISKTCFTCGMKGHINATCPNRRAARRGDLDRYDDCDRCGSARHITSECPTLWRLYSYLSEEMKNLTLETRRQKQHLSLGEGGEGYIADDEWCYNCGGCGHWGDDCQDLPHRQDVPDESSAFSEHNTLSGPFFDSAERPASKRRRREPRDWELANDLPATWGNVPENVGKQGRKNQVAKMERKAHLEAVEDDPDDWFGDPRNVRNLGVPQNNGNRNFDSLLRLASLTALAIPTALMTLGPDDARQADPDLTCGTKPNMGPNLRRDETTSIDLNADLIVTGAA